MYDISFQVSSIVLCALCLATDRSSKGGKQTAHIATLFITHALCVCVCLCVCTKICPVVPYQHSQLPHRLMTNSHCKHSVLTELRRSGNCLLVFCLCAPASLCVCPQPVKRSVRWQRPAIWVIFSWIFIRAKWKRNCQKKKTSFMENWIVIINSVNRRSRHKTVR